MIVELRISAVRSKRPGVWQLVATGQLPVATCHTPAAAVPSSPLTSSEISDKAAEVCRQVCASNQYSESSERRLRLSWGSCKKRAEGACQEHPSCLVRVCPEMHHDTMHHWVPQSLSV